LRSEYERLACVASARGVEFPSAFSTESRLSIDVERGYHSMVYSSTDIKAVLSPVVQTLRRGPVRCVRGPRVSR
jgi:hypothetical protein